MNPYVIGVIIQSGISVITVSAIFVLTGLTGMVSFGQAAFMSIGAYFTVILASTLSISLWLSSIIGILVAGVVAYIIGTPILKLRKDYFALITVILGQAVVALVITFKSVTNGSLGFSRVPKVENLIFITLVLMVIVIWMVANFKYSRFGRMCIALKNDELAAKSFGINVYNLKIYVYVFASMLAASAGILYALQTRLIEPTAFGWTKSSEMVIFLFFGGTNSLTGSVISAFSLNLLPEILRGIYIFGKSLQEYRVIIYCILIIVILNFRPAGIFGEYELNLRKLKNKLTDFARKVNLKGGRK